MGLISAGARLPGFTRWPASGSVTGRSVLGVSEIRAFMPGSEIVGRLSWMPLLDLSKLERKFEPKAVGELVAGGLTVEPVPVPSPKGVPRLLEGLSKVLGGVLGDVPGNVRRIAGGFVGIVVPGVMNGAVVEGTLVEGTPITPVPGGGMVRCGVRMLLNPRDGVVVLGITGTTVAGATVLGL